MRVVDNDIDVEMSLDRGMDDHIHSHIERISTQIVAVPRIFGRADAGDYIWQMYNKLQSFQYCLRCVWNGDRFWLEWIWGGIVSVWVSLYQYFRIDSHWHDYRCGWFRTFSLAHGTHTHTLKMLEIYVCICSYRLSCLSRRLVTFFLLDLSFDSIGITIAVLVVAVVISLLRLISQSAFGSVSLSLATSPYPVHTSWLHKYRSLDTAWKWNDLLCLYFTISTSILSFRLLSLHNLTLSTAFNAYHFNSCLSITFYWRNF